MAEILVIVPCGQDAAGELSLSGLLLAGRSGKRGKC